MNSGIRVTVVFIFFLAGVFVTAPIITIRIAGTLVSIFSILFGLLYSFTLWFAIRSRTSFSTSRVNLALVTWHILSLVASIVGVVYFSDLNASWMQPAINFGPKILLYLSFLLCVMKWREGDYALVAFLYGFLYGCIANLTWSIFEGVYYYTFDAPLNDVLFLEYVKTVSEDRQYMTVIADGIVRASGFNIDPAHLGVLIPIVFVYGLVKRNIYLLVLSLASLVFSGSTTAAVVCVLGFVVTMGRLELKKISFKSACISTLAAIFVFTGLMASDGVRGGILNNIQGFYERSTENYVDGSDQGPRYIYHAYLVEAISYSHIKVLTGTGFGTASYPYVDNPEIGRILDEENRPYDPESTYISYLFDTGFFGVLIYIFVIVSAIVIYRRRIMSGSFELIVYSSLCGIFFAGFFYHYTLTAYQILILTIAVVARDRHRALIVS